MIAYVRIMTSMLASGKLTLPNTLLLLSVSDGRYCTQNHMCT